MEPPQTDDREPLVISVKEAARLLRLGRNQAYDAVRTGQLPSIRVGRRILVPWGPLKRLVDGQPE